MQTMVFIAKREYFALLQTIPDSDAADCCIHANALIGPSVKASTGLAPVNELRSRNSRFLAIRTFQPTPTAVGAHPERAQRSALPNGQVFVGRSETSEQQP